MTVRAVRKFLCKTFLWILITPYVLLYTGAGLNQLVLIANGDKFPVMIDKDHPKFPLDPQHPGYFLGDDTHCVMTNKTHLNFLADIFDFHDATMSIGDMLLGLADTTHQYSEVLWGSFVIFGLARRDDRDGNDSAGNA